MLCGYATKVYCRYAKLTFLSSVPRSVALALIATSRGPQLCYYRLDIHSLQQRDSDLEGKYLAIYHRLRSRVGRAERR
jgi:hypothetical protein